MTVPNSQTAWFHEPEFFPPLSFFYGLLNSNIWIVLDHLPFKIRSCQHLCRIRTNIGGVHALRIGIKRPIRSLYKTQINNYQPWQQNFLSTIHRSYERNPHFPIYFDDLTNFIHAPCIMLEALNVQTTLWIAGLLKHKPTVIYTHNFDEKLSKTRTVKTLSRRLGVTRFHKRYKEKEYPQYVGAFEKDLSVLDALFNLGAAETRRLLIEEE